MVEFGSSVDAVQCAVEIQRAIAVRNSDKPEDQQLILRIGISQGDVIVEGDDLFGNGVNVAARMEGLAEPGGICVSGNVQEHVGNTLEVDLEDLGNQSVKNIDTPVRCYRVHLESGGAPRVHEHAPDGALPLPDKPSIAVLPFQNMSGDPDQEYFADGIAEDIITALSRFNWFFVIARNSSFSYKGTSPDIRQVASELGVQYVLEGSVRKNGDRVRITAQLIEAATGRHVWAERYDRDLNDIFEVQDEITGAITGAVGPSFVAAEAKRAGRKAPENLDAWDLTMRGNWYLWRLSKKDLTEAKRCFMGAIELDPNSGIAHSGLALVYQLESGTGWAEDAQENRDQALLEARRAVALDDQDAWGQAALAMVQHVCRDNAAAMATCEKALGLNPNLSFARGLIGMIHTHLGNFEEARSQLDQAVRLSPRDASQMWIQLARLVVALGTGQDEEYLALAKSFTEATPEYVAFWRHLAVAYANLGRLDEGKEAIQQLLRLAPGDTVELVSRNIPIVDPQIMERFLDGLRKAGMP
jgi:adenylate cyclase